jgi:RNA-directed DNA polymerase
LKRETEILTQRRKKMYTKLDRIAEIARNNPKEKFTSLMHLVNKEMLTICHKELGGNKATGVDKVTKEEYGVMRHFNLQHIRH